MGLALAGRGQPPEDDGGTPCRFGERALTLLWWGGDVWKESMYMAQFAGEVVAWAPLPVCPTRPKRKAKR